MPAAWLWIPVTIWAAFAQTIRNAAQRHLTAELGTLGATLVRFLYGMPVRRAVAFVVRYATWRRDSADQSGLLGLGRSAR